MSKLFSREGLFESSISLATRIMTVWSSYDVFICPWMVCAFVVFFSFTTEYFDFFGEMDNCPLDCMYSGNYVVVYETVSLLMFNRLVYGTCVGFHKISYTN